MKIIVMIFLSIIAIQALAIFIFFKLNNKLKNINKLLIKDIKQKQKNLDLIDADKVDKLKAVKLKGKDNGKTKKERADKADNIQRNVNKRVRKSKSKT